MVANTVDDLLEGPTEISWMLYNLVEPIVRGYLENGRVISIDDVFLDKGGRKNRREAETERRAAEEEILRNVNAWIEEGLEDLYATQAFFDREMRKAEAVKPIDTHMFTTYGAFHEGFTSHAQRFIRASNLPPETVEALRKIIDFDRRETGITLNRSVYLGMRHGTLRITDIPSYPIVFQVSRIKDPTRMGRKFARYVCEGIQEWRIMQAYLDGHENRKERDKKIAEGLKELENGNKDDRKTAERIIENFGAMHAHGLRTPFAEQEELHIGREGVDPLEYVLMRCRVSDVLGVMNVVRTESEVKELIERTKNGKFYGEENYRALFGKRLRKEGKTWGYVNEFIVDDQGRRIFTYGVPKRPLERNNIRIDFGVEALRNYADDAVGGERSHIIHEARQEVRIKGWRRDIQKLYGAICNAVNSPLERLDMKRYEVYKGFPFQTEARAK
ncbi:hypothetical protein HZC31_06760 [Candidatus Woesearchaeota archaeon]|nr:hypothetical protein [Candidatus Woesearchaeota archaeon]